MCHIVLASYRRILTVPGARLFTFAAFIMRMPMSMMGLSIVLLVSARTGSYGLAGAVSAVFALSIVPSAPILGRLMDRYGQARVVIPTTMILALGSAGLVSAVELQSPHWTLFLCAVVMALGTLPGQSMTRARWSALLSDTDQLKTAYSWEQVLDELIFIVGPIIATLLATQVVPAGGIVGAITLNVIGLIALLFARKTEPPPRELSRSSTSVVRIPGVLVLFIAFFGLGGVFISIEVVTVAFADSKGHRAAAAWMLALLATSSMIAGLIYGARRWRGQLKWHLFLAVLVLESGLSSIFS